MAESGDILEALKLHNEELLKLLSKDGRRELDRLILLELALHAYTDGRLSEYKEMPIGALIDRLQTNVFSDDGDAANGIANDINQFMKIPDTVKNVGKKIGSVANSYVKKKVSVILGGDDDGDD